jgi:serine/threonine protein kinase
VSQTERFDDTHFLSLGGSTRAIKPGDIVGGAYILKSLLGQGGMGYVFLAQHNIIKRDYALKIIRPDKMDDFSWQRFEIEGRVIAKLDHPNIVKIYDMGIDQG